MCICKFLSKLECYKSHEIAGMLFAGVFTVSYIGTVLSLYAGWSFIGSDQDVLLTRSILGIWAMLHYAIAFYMLRNRQISNVSIVLVGAILLFFIFCYGSWYLRFGLTSGLQNIPLRFLGMMIPSLVAGIYSGRNMGGKRAFCYMECVSVFIIPSLLVYVSGLFGVQHYLAYKDIDHRGMGLLNYMSIAYMCMPFALSHMICFIKGEKTGTGCYVWQPLRLVAIIVYSVAIVVTATRGAMFCVASSLTMLLMITFLEGKRRYASVFVWLTVIIVFVVGSFVKGSPMAYRMSFFVDGLENGKFVTATNENITEEEIENIITKEPGQLNESIKARISNRGTLYRLAWAEFMKKTVTGIEAGGYSAKYGRYPHNGLLELLCETGVVGFSIVGGILCFAAISIWRQKTELNDRLAVGFFSAYLLFLIISGTIWTDFYLFFIMGYGIGNRENNGRYLGIGEQTAEAT